MSRAHPPNQADDSPTSRRAKLSSSAIETLAGFTAGSAATFVVHPFDVLKTRLQLETKQSHWGSSFNILRAIVRDEGSYAALYRGLVPNLAGNSISWALYFLFYSRAKEVFQSHRGTTTQLTSSDYFLASGSAGIATAILTNPIWVLKTRILSSGRDAPGAYRNMSHGIAQIWRADGIKGFWRGLVPSLFGISHGAVQFSAYEQLKNYRRGQKRQPDKASDLNNIDYLVLSGTSKIFAGSITYPYQVLRVRMQKYNAEQSYKGLLDAVQQTWGQEGVRGFYKGLAPNILRVLPSTCVTFLVYENVKSYLTSRNVPSSLS